LGIPSLLVGIVALIAALWLGATNAEIYNHLLHSYLTAYCFFLAITIGSILFILIEYATRSAWSVTVRRLAEGISQNIFLLIILFIPILINDHKMLGWLEPGIVQNDTALTLKSGYLNPTFLYLRLAAYFLLFAFTARYYHARSTQQDITGDPRITTHLEHLSFPLIILTALALTGFAFDWIKSLNPHWFSTIFGVYFFAGAMLAAISAITLLALILQIRSSRCSVLSTAINQNHYHDLAKWIFAYTIFWAYIAFSQYLLIWYANIPEETQFYIPRQIDIWASVSLLLLAVHFVIPFLGLLARRAKRKSTVIAFWAIWSLLACALDIFYLVMPNAWSRDISRTVNPANPHAPLTDSLPILLDRHNVHALRPEFNAFYHQIRFPFEPLNLLITALCFIGIGGLFICFTLYSLKGKPLVPTQDPRLKESLAYENA